MTPNRHRRRRMGAIVAACAWTAVLGAAAPGQSRLDEVTDGRILHTLNRITFGPRPGDVERVRQLGLDRYLEQQLHPEDIADGPVERRLAGFGTLAMSSAELAEKFFLPAREARRRNQAAAAARPDMAGAAPAVARDVPPDVAVADDANVIAELSQARLIRAVESERQLQEVLTDFWFNHFNVFVGKGQVRQYLTEYERDTIRPNVLGSFRTLLGAVAHSPAMLIYLDNWQSTGPSRPDTSDIEQRLNDPRLSPAARQQLTQRLMQRQQAARPARGLNENYARELMELHTLGVGGGYAQADVVALARILTGWTIDQPLRGGGFVFRPRQHDDGAKELLGRTFAAAGEAEGEFALDMLAAHPATARLVAFKLAQRFVADKPPAELVDRAARVFVDTRGDLREVTRAILTSPEFTGEEHRRGKVKTPLEFVVSAVRATGASVVDAQPLVAALRSLGMPLYGCQPPTGYGATAADWVGTGALLDRMNFATSLVGGLSRSAAGRRAADGGAGTRAAGRAARGGGASPAVSLDLASIARDTSEASLESAIATLLGGEVSAGTRQTIARASTPAQLVVLTLGSPEFQRR